MSEKALGCARPIGGPVEEDEQIAVNQKKNENAEKQKMITVNEKAPDFAAPGYHKGEFINVKLSDYLGKWVVLCFYPGDFTFV